MKRSTSNILRFASALLMIAAVNAVNTQAEIRQTTTGTKTTTLRSEAAGVSSALQTVATTDIQQTGGEAQATASQDTLLRVKVGDQVPSFTVEMFDGSKICMDSLRGKVVWVNFWATWCPPCRAELKQVQSQIIDRFQGQDFIFLPISRGETKETVAAFRKAQGYTFPMGLDPNKEIYSLFASMTIPRNFLIDQNGKIVACEVGYTPDKLTDMINQVENLLKQQ